MAKSRYPSIPVGNDFTAKFPFCIKQQDGTIVYIDTKVLTDIVIEVKKGSTEVTTYTWRTDKNYFLIDFPEDLAVGMYSVVISAKLLGRDISSRIQEAFEIVKWNGESTYLNFIAGDEEAFPDSVFIYSSELEDILSIIGLLMERVAEAEEAGKHAQEAADAAIAIKDEIEQKLATGELKGEKGEDAHANEISNELINKIYKEA